MGVMVSPARVAHSASRPDTLKPALSGSLHRGPRIVNRVAGNGRRPRADVSLTPTAMYRKIRALHLLELIRDAYYVYRWHHRQG